MRNTKKILSALLAATMLCLTCSCGDAANEPAVSSAGADSKAESLTPAASSEAAPVATDEILSGTCGDNVNWTLNVSTGELTVSGTGDMYGYSADSAGGLFTPWCAYGEQIKKIIVEEGVTSIGVNAFSDCVACVSAELPASVVSDIFDVGVESLAGLSKLTSINVAEDNPYYASDDGVLFNKGLTRLICFPAGRGGSYTVPDSVSTIDKHAFINCRDLTDVTIPSSVTSIGNSAFAWCTGLSSVTIPSGIRQIDAFVFADCTGLKSITLPASIDTVAVAAFENCTGLTDVYYAGTQEQWEAIGIEEDNDSLTKATVHFAA